MTLVLQEPDIVLRKKATIVSLDDIKNGSCAIIVESMKTALHQEEDGVAIAAPQIGISKRIFVVARKASKKFKDAEDDIVFINPEIIRLGKQKAELSEGCLSVRWKYGIVKRATTATVRAQNLQGNTFVMNAQGLLAQIFQHEIDHLNGILFIDKAKNIEDIPPQE